jgi:hypothetical protein
MTNICYGKFVAIYEETREENKRYFCPKELLRKTWQPR